MTHKKRGNKTKTEKPPVALPLLADVRIEVRQHSRGCVEIAMYGCGGIVTYSHERVALRMRKSVVYISGEDLWCYSYGNRVAEVRGKVKEISFSEVGYD